MISVEEIQKQFRREQEAIVEKLEEADGGDHQYIRSVYSIGYLFVAPHDEQDRVSA